MPTVLWPAGYLLAQWASGGCAKVSRGAKVIELGAGVGAASVACALSGAHVLATDVAPTRHYLLWPYYPCYDYTSYGMPTLRHSYYERCAHQSRPHRGQRCTQRCRGAHRPPRLA